MLKIITNQHSPLVILMSNEEFVQLLPLKLQLVVIIFLDRLTVGNIVVLSGKESLERHHGRLLPLGGWDRRPWGLSEQKTSLKTGEQIGFVSMVS